MSIEMASIVIHGKLTSFFFNFYLCLSVSVKTKKKFLDKWNVCAQRERERDIERKSKEIRNTFTKWVFFIHINLVNGNKFKLTMVKPFEWRDARQKEKNQRTVTVKFAIRNNGVLTTLTCARIERDTHTDTHIKKGSFSKNARFASKLQPMKSVARCTTVNTIIRQNKAATAWCLLHFWAECDCACAKVRVRVYNQKSDFAWKSPDFEGQKTPSLRQNVLQRQP